MNKIRQFIRLRKTGLTIPFDPNDPKRPGGPKRIKRVRAQKSVGPVQALIQGHNVEEGLARLNEMVAKANSPTRKAKLVGLIAELKTRQGRFEEAIAAHQAAGAFVVNHPRAWLRPVIGELLVLLKNARVQESADLAEVAWLKAASLSAAAQSEINLTAAAFAKLGAVTVSQRPHRASVIGSRFANLFLREGEYELARLYFQRAADSAPTGASRARQGLARVLLVLGQYADAERCALESLTFGKFSAKTLATWRVLIEARAKQGIQGLKAEWLAGPQSLKTRAKDTVRARAVLEIVKALRAQDDSSWKTIAAHWLSSDGAKFPIEAVELRKIQKSEGGPLATTALTALLAKPEILSHSEWLSVIRSKVRSDLAMGNVPNLARVFQQIAQFQGVGSAVEARHTAGLALLESGQKQLAANTLRESLSLAEKGSPAWLRSSWRLGRLEKAAGRFAEAALVFRALYEEPQTKEQFRYRALVEWVRCLATAPDPNANAKQTREVVRALKIGCELIEDYKTLLDIGRDLLAVGGEIGAQCFQFFEKGTLKAKAQFLKPNQHPAVILVALYHLFLRQHDLGAYAQTIATWEGLSESLKQVIWSERREYWDMQRHVVRAYGWSNDLNTAEALALPLLDDPATPQIGRTLLGVALGQLYNRHGMRGKAIGAFQAYTPTTPDCEESAAGYFWLSLWSYRQNDFSAADHYAAKIPKAVGECPKIYWMARYRICAALIQAHFNREVAKAALPGFSMDQVADALEYIELSRKELL